jgi:UDPglucose 6-dehydrogenase
VAGKTLGVLGLAFKANTDDMRDASALTILPELLKKGAKIAAFDPAAMPRAQQLMPTLTYATSAAEALKNADAAIILTDWAEFRTLDWAAIKGHMAGHTVIDLRNVLSKESLQNLGLTYYGLGR